MRLERRSRSEAAGLAAAAFVLVLYGCSQRPGAPENAGAAGGCLPWVNFPVDMHSNAETPYLGCTNRANLEKMVDRPADLDNGETLGPASGEREAHAVDAYEQGKIKPFTDSSIAGPTIVLPGGASGAP